MEEMKRTEYSAGMVKLSFWFSEFRKVIYLMNNGNSLEDIKRINMEGNIFSAPSQARATQIFNAVSSRVKGLDPSLYHLFEQSDVSTQKIITLIALMQTDSLFFDFVYEVYREKLIMGSEELADSEIRIFFKDKQIQSEKVAKWTDYTIKRLGTCYKTLLMESGLTDRSVGNRKVLKPILDQKLVECLKNNGMDLMLHALTGVR